MKRTLMLVTVLLSSAALAQQGPASTSTLTRIRLTPGAVRVTDAASTREFGQVLNALAKDQNSGCQTSEYLVWDDPDLAENVSDNLADQFQARGITFKQLGEDEDEESYSVSFLLTEKTSRYVGLLYGDAESVVLGWCQLKVAPPKPAASAAKPAGPGKPGGPPASPMKVTGAALAGDYVCVSGGAPELSTAGPVSQAPVNPVTAQIRSLESASKYRLFANGTWGDLTFGEKYSTQPGYKGTYRVGAQGDVDLLSDRGSRLYLLRPVPTTDRRLALVEVHQPRDRYKAQFCTRVD